jgi:N-methylhydantoinase A
LTGFTNGVPQAALPHRLSIDIGGTFTDLVLRHVESGESWVGKVLTTPADPAQGVHAGVIELLAETGVNADQIQSVLHATTLATNALIERTGARTGLLTTAGFRDVLEIRDESRYDLFDLFLELPVPLVPRDLRVEVPERTLADGSIGEPLDESAARHAIEALGNSGVEAVAVSLLHSYRNPEHERRLGALLRELLPSVELSLSHEVAPEIREFPRTATTIANVYIKRLMTRYLERVRLQLEEVGFHHDLLVMLSSGSLCDVATAGEFPVRLIESGPAAGALGAAAYGRAVEREELISFDMGGTTAKVCLVEGGEAQRSDQFEVDRVWRFKPGSGTPIQTPVIDLIEIGAGGGSIAWIDNLGILRVGPESAGAEPGPACYGHGGTQPTVTDADLVLGYLDPDSFLGGRMKLDPEASVHAIEEKVARPMDIDVVRAAAGIHRIVNETMAGAARMAATERGNDPRGYPIFAFGGAGPVHACGVAAILGSPDVMMPRGAGVMSAIGLLCAPLAFDFVRSWVGLLDEVDWEHVTGLLEEMEDAGREILARSRIQNGQVKVVRGADMRYLGQGYELAVPLPEVSRADLGSELALAFQGAYGHRYGRALPGVPVEIVNWRCSAAGPVPSLAQPDTAAGVTVDRPSKSRQIFLAEANEFATVPVYDRSHLSTGATIEGPAIIEENESTFVVGQVAEITVDERENVIATMTEH